jgi:predicted nucleic-acid-binding protein
MEADSNFILLLRTEKTPLINFSLRQLFIITVIFILFASCGPSKDDAVKYNDTIVEQEMLIVNKEDSLIEAISRNQPDKAEQLYKDFVIQINSSIEKINKTEAFDHETDFRKAAIELFKSYKSAAENEYADMMKITRIPNETYTKEDDDKLIDLSKTVFDKLNIGLGKFSKAQKNFADKYKIELTNKSIDQLKTK